MGQFGIVVACPEPILLTSPVGPLLCNMVVQVEFLTLPIDATLSTVSGVSGSSPFSLCKVKIAVGVMFLSLWHHMGDFGSEGSLVRQTMEEGLGSGTFMFVLDVWKIRNWIVFQVEVLSIRNLKLCLFFFFGQWQSGL